MQTNTGSQIINGWTKDQNYHASFSQSLLRIYYGPEKEARNDTAYVSNLSSIDLQQMSSVHGFLTVRLFARSAPFVQNSSNILTCQEPQKQLGSCMQPIILPFWRFCSKVPPRRQIPSEPAIRNCLPGPPQGKCSILDVARIVPQSLRMQLPGVRRVSFENGALVLCLSLGEKARLRRRG